MGCGVAPSAARVAAADMHADASCDYVARCSPAVLALFNNDPTTCAATYSYTNRHYVGVDDQAFNACLLANAAALAAAPCGTTVPPLTCTNAGLLANGEACRDRFECMGGACVGPAMGGCRVCATAVGVNGSCSFDRECAAGLACNAGTCKPPQANGATCTAASHCQSSFCSGGQCASQTYVDAGQACSTPGPRCELTEPLLCVNGLCASNPIPAGGLEGQACVAYKFEVGITITAQLCEPGTKCVGGVCVAAGLAGGPCSAADQCQGNTSCVAGTCVVPGLATCVCGP